ncbi:MAG: alcohol dehydrogenase, partial [Asgard group archaeon]
GLELLAKRGRLSMFSGLPSETPIIPLNSNEIHYKEAQIIGAYGCTSLQNRQAIGLLGSGKIDVSGLITHRFKLDDILEGFRVIELKKGLKAVIKTQT